MDYTREEAEIIVAVSATVEGARLNTEAVTFAARTLALASGAHPWKLGYLLDRLGVLTERGGYRRNIAALVEAIEKALPEAQDVLEQSDDELREMGYVVPERKKSKKQDATGELRLGDDVFTG